MLRNRPFPAPLVLVLLTLATHAGADVRYNHPIGGTTLDCGRPSIATGTWMWLTAWEAGGEVDSRFEGIVLPGEKRALADYFDHHGPGTLPETGLLHDGTYILAFVRGTELVVREQTGFSTWSTVAVADLGPATQATSRIDLWCSGYPEYPSWAWLAVWSGNATGGGIRFLRRSELGWGQLETIPGAAPQLNELSFPQVTTHSGPYSPLPRVYYVDMDEEPCLKHVDHELGSGWTTPVAHTGIHVFGGEFDVARASFGYVFLTTGLQPTCPCNQISFCEWLDDDGWQAPLAMTVPTDHYDWPLSPRIGFDMNGELVHALWFQLGSDPTMAPHSRRLHYLQRDVATWTDHSDELAELQDTGLESHLSLSVDAYGCAAFAFARRDTLAGVPRPAAVWESLPGLPSDGVGDATPRLRAVKAVPNPFNPTVTLDVAADGPVMALEIFDPCGRRVADLTPVLADGSWRAMWDGRDGRGRELPSGAYLVRARDAAGTTAACKVMLAR